jgi:hypothetical protein
VGYKGEIILLANLVYFMYAWYRDSHIDRLCRVHFFVCICSTLTVVRQGRDGAWNLQESG